jgi:putative ABC transport system ATP-binding protein
MIKIRNIERSYKSKAGFTYVLRKINLDIVESEFITIMGPYGAGKSTLRSILGLHDRAWEGEIHFTKYGVHRLSPEEKPALVVKVMICCRKRI